MKRELTDLIECPTFHTLAVRACLRRQVEREKPPRKGEQGTPVRPLCASGTCELGRKVWSERPVDVAPCGACGAALFAGAACEACATRETETPGMATRQLRSGAYLEVGRSGPVSSRIWTEKPPDPPLVPPAGREGVRGTAQPSADRSTDQEESHAPSAGKASASPDPAPPAVSTTPAPVQHDARLAARTCTSGSAEDRVKAALAILRKRRVVHEPPANVDGHRGGERGSASRLAAARLTAKASGVMTSDTCKCGCGRPLRKNNTPGWSGYRNPKRYAAGERPPRKSQAKHQPEETEMEETQAGAVCACGRRIRMTPNGERHEKCGACRGTTHPHVKAGKVRKTPSRAAPKAAVPKIAAAPANDVDPDVAALTDDDLARLARSIAAEIDRRLSTLTAARNALGKAA